jgi:hypothetical protein
MAMGIVLILLHLFVFVPVGAHASIDFKGTIPTDIICSDDSIGTIMLGFEGGKVTYNVRGVGHGLMSVVFVEKNGDRTLFLVIVPKPKVRD